MIADIPSGQPDGTRPVLDQSRERFEQRRFSGTVRADDRYRLAGMQLEIDPEQSLKITIEGVERRDIQERGHAGTPI